VTGRAAFGDFLRQARRSLDPGAHPGETAALENLEDVISALARLVAVMGRYAQDLTATLPEITPHAQPVLSPWAEASTQARDALTSAWPRPTAIGRPGAQTRRLDAATMSLRMGRDLLQTHFVTDPKGGRRPRSEWAHVITSEAVARALLAELAWFARNAADQCSPLALSPSAHVAGDRQARRRLNLACQWLWVLQASVRAAHQRAPITGAGAELLSGIPVNTLLPRPVLRGGEPIAALCEGAISSAERVRYLAWMAADRVPASRNVTAASLRQVAEHSTVTGHHCASLLDVLAARMAQAGDTEASDRLTIAAEAARRARDTWLQAAREVARIRTIAPGLLSPAAIEAAELTSWTGRLVYADPQWSPAAGPDRPLRPPETLAEEDLPQLISAAHHAYETLTGLALAEYDQVRAAAKAGRILVPTRSLPDEYDIPYPFARAPRERAELLLKRYGEAAQASRRATEAAGDVAEMIRAPSRTLALARSAANGQADPLPDVTDVASERSAPPGSDASAAGMPGPVETTLLDLGVTDPRLLARSAEIDHDAERLIIDAAVATDAHQRPVRGLSRSTGTAALVNHALQAGDPRAVALLRPPRRAQREPPEREP
jgi:hypothetical protein